MSNAFSVFRDLNPYYAELYAKRADLESAKSKKEKDMKINLEREEVRLKEKRRVREEMEEEVSRRQRADSAMAARSGLPHEMGNWDLEEIMGREKARPPQSFSSVVTAVMKGKQARNMLKKMISERKEQRVRKSDSADLAPERASSESQQPSIETSKSSYISKPLEGTGTISFQLSLMTGRGMDSVKAELCMLNALTVLSGAQVTSRLEDSGKPLSAEEYCEEGLKCIANIPEESGTTKISNYSHTCDQVHTLLVEAKLYSILERIAASNPSSSQKNDTSEDSSTRSNMMHDDSEISSPMSSEPSPLILPLSPTSDSPLPIPGEHTRLGRDRKYYANKAVESMKKCETLARIIDAPGVLFLTGLSMISLDINAKSGREILSEAMEILEIDEKNQLDELERNIVQKETRAKAQVADEGEESIATLSNQFFFIETGVDDETTQQLNIDASEEISGKSQDLFHNLEDAEYEVYEADFTDPLSWNGKTPKTKAYRKLAPVCSTDDIPIVVDAKRALRGH